MCSGTKMICDLLPDPKDAKDVGKFINIIINIFKLIYYRIIKIFL